MLETRELKSPKTNYEIVASVQTDVGIVRQANEDSGRHTRPNDAEILRRKGTLTVVADGMGGHLAGEVASEMAVELISDFYYNDDSRATGAALKNAIENSNQIIYNTANADEKLFGMGTTVVALVVQNSTAFIAHVGDSRVYRLRGQEFDQITLDHSQVMEMVKYNLISLDEARTHPDKNVILRALGTQPEVEAELSEPLAIEPNDTFLLCSDGLSDMLEDLEIKAVLHSAKDIFQAGEQLINLANERGGHDNITVGLVKLSDGAAAQTTGRVRTTREIKAAR